MPGLASDAAPRSGDDWRKRATRSEKSLRYLRSSRNVVGRATVANGKNLVIKGILSVVGALNLTGTISMKSVDGDELIRMGDMSYGDRGLTFTRETGVKAFELRKKNNAAEDQSWSLYDFAGNEIVAEQQFLRGLAKPYLEYPFQPVAAVSGTPVVCGPAGIEQTTSSGTFETLFVYDGKRQNAFIDLKVVAVCSDGSTAGEVQIVNLATGSPLPGFAVSPWLGVIPAGTTTLTEIDPSPSQAGLYGFEVGDQMRLGVQVRVTAGAGSITLAIPQAIGG